MSKKEIKNVIEKVIKIKRIIQKIFELSIDERNNLNECFNSNAELKNDNKGNLCAFKGKSSIFWNYSNKYLYKFKL